MADIKPFKALIYNKKKIGNLSKVICPPYDIINKRQQAEYYQSSPYNIIRLLLNKDTNKDDAQNNRYTRAKEAFHNWIGRKVLVRDTKECFYLHKHVFKVGAKTFARYGIIGLLRLKKSVKGHERTKAEPTKDRLRLIREVHANLSPIFGLFTDTNNIIDKTFKSYFKNAKPFLKFTDRDRNSHSLWRIDDPEINNKFIKDIKRKHIFIADGHHRYAVGLKFAAEMNKRHKSTRDKEPWHYIMSYFTGMDSKGLVILPVHRLIKSIPKDKLEYILDILAKYFKIEAIKSKVKFLAYFKKAKKQRYCFGLYFKNADCFYVLRPKDKQIAKKAFPRHRKEFYNLDIFVLENLIIKKLLGVKDKSQLSYDPAAGSAVKSVANNEADAAFLVYPTKIGEVKRIALIDGHMPAKSTYFYPKVLAGLAVNKF